MSPDPPLTKAEIDEINRYLMAAAKPNSKTRILDGWAMPVPGGVWELIPIDGPVVELYRHEILEYVAMLQAAGLKPWQPSKKPIHWPGDNA